MQKRSLLLVLAVSALSAAAASQQIVIEPTNGRAQAPATRVTRPAATDIAPVSKAERPTHAQRAAPKPAVNHHTEKQVAKVKTAPVVEAKNEPRETIPAPAQPAAPQKKYPARPAWAMNDTRDPNDLEQEITQAFAGDSKLKGSAIQVKVDDEAVTLAAHWELKSVCRLSALHKAMRGTASWWTVLRFHPECPHKNNQKR